MKQIHCNKGCFTVPVSRDKKDADTQV